MDDFIGELKTIDWFAKSGTLNEKYHVIASFYEAYDGYWGKRSFEVWEQYICPLEETATLSGIKWGSLLKERSTCKRSRRYASSFLTMLREMRHGHVWKKC